MNSEPYLTRKRYRIEMWHKGCGGVWWKCDDFKSQAEAFAAVLANRKMNGGRYRVIEVNELEIERWPATPV